LFFAAALASCRTATTKIGTSCRKDGDCNVAGQKCLPSLVTGQGATGDSVCTHSCTGEYGDTGCANGFDCRTIDTNLGSFCYKAPYTVGDNGAPVLFGKTCASDADCAGTGDPNPMPSCRKALDPSSVYNPFRSPAGPLKPLPTDLAAYCTG